MTKLSFNDSGSLNIKFGKPEDKSILGHVTRNTGGINHNTAKHHNHINNSNINPADSKFNYYYNMADKGTLQYVHGKYHGTFNDCKRLIHKLDKRQYGDYINHKNRVAKSKRQKNRMTTLDKYVNSGARKKRTSYALISFGKGFNKKLERQISIVHGEYDNSHVHNKAKDIESRALYKYCNNFNRRHKYIRMLAYGTNVDEDAHDDGTPHAHIYLYDMGHTAKGKPSPTVNNALECDTGTRRPRKARQIFYKQQMVQLHQDLDATFNRTFRHSGYHLKTYYRRTHSKNTGLTMSKYKKLSEHDKRLFVRQRDALSKKLDTKQRQIKNNTNTYHHLRSAVVKSRTTLRNYRSEGSRASSVATSYSNMAGALKDVYNGKSFAQSQALHSQATSTYNSLADKINYNNTRIDFGYLNYIKYSLNVSSLVNSDYDKVMESSASVSSSRSLVNSESAGIAPSLSYNNSVSASNHNDYISNSSNSASVSSASNFLKQQQDAWTADKEYRDSIISNKDNTISGQNNDINGNKDTLASQSNAISKNKSTLSSQNVSINDNKRTINNQNDIKASNNDIISNQNNTISKNKGIISKLSNAVSSLRKNYDAIKSKVSTFLSNKISDFRKSISRIKRHYDSNARDSLDNINTTINSMANSGNAKSINVLRSNAVSSATSNNDTNLASVSNQYSKANNSDTIKSQVGSQVKSLLNRDARRFNVNTTKRVENTSINSSESSSVRPSSASSSQSQVSHVSKIARKSSSNSSTFGSQYHHNGPEIN